MPLPIILLFILMIKGFTLSGAGDGVEEYIWKFSGSKLENTDIWSQAVGQVFFSLSVSHILVFTSCIF